MTDYEQQQLIQVLTQLSLAMDTIKGLLNVEPAAEPAALLLLDDWLW